jgi:hypothetical protein
LRVSDAALELRLYRGEALAQPGLRPTGSDDSIDLRHPRYDLGVLSIALEGGRDEHQNLHDFGNPDGGAQGD